MCKWLSVVHQYADDLRIELEVEFTIPCFQSTVMPQRQYIHHIHVNLGSNRMSMNMIYVPIEIYYCPHGFIYRDCQEFAAFKPIQQ